MTDLTEDGLKKIMEEIRQMVRDECGLITLKPTKMIFRPADLKQLGLTPNKVLHMIEKK